MQILRLSFIAVFIFSSLAYSQQTDCKVKIPEISLSYTGQCKKGLAHGKGIARGIDSYEGQFIKGLPEGNGIYKWSNGIYYEGKWKNGMRNGKGKMVSPDSVVTGYWRDNNYLGEELRPPYRIIKSRNLAKYKITKSVAPGNGVKIRIFLAGSDNADIVDFSLAYSSGSEYRMGTTFGIQNTSIPLDVIVRYNNKLILRHIFRFKVSSMDKINSNILIGKKTIIADQ